MTLGQLVQDPRSIEALKCALIHALPLVFLALWCSTILEEIEDGEGGAEAAGRPTAEGAEPASGWLRQAQIVYSFTVVGQVVAYGVCREITATPFHLNLILFFLAIFGQTALKAGLERKLDRRARAPAGTGGGAPAAASESAVRVGRAMAIVFCLFVAYLAIVHGLGAAFSRGAALLKAGETAQQCARLVGSFAGVFVSLVTVFALAPWILRLFLPVTKLKDSRAIHMLDGFFTEAGLKPPEFWQLDLEVFGSHNALVAGLRAGRGFLRPALFVSRSLLRDFTAGEIRAVLLHEISHVKLRHLRSRFWLTFSVLLGSCVVAAAIVVLALRVFPTEVVALFAFPAAFIPAFAPYFAVLRQIRRQEIEADEHAVFELGASIEDLAGALARLDALNARLGRGAGPQGESPSYRSTHPTTEERIKHLRAEQVRRGGYRKGPAESDRKAA